MSHGFPRKTEMKGDTSRWCRRAEAETNSKRLRRANDRQEVREALGHKARVRASLDWALDEYASTLAKLSQVAPPEEVLAEDEYERTLEEFEEALWGSVE